MEKVLTLNNANDYARSVGAPVYHDLVSVVHYDEVGEIRHDLCRFNVYAIFVQNNYPSQLTYGVGRYFVDGDSLAAYAPGQIGGAEDNGEREVYHGWALFFDPKFIYGTAFEQNLSNYQFFSYNTNEGLRLQPDEMAQLYHIMETIRNELIQKKPLADRIIQDYIVLLADLCNRFYERQFQTEAVKSSDLLARFQHLLLDYYETGRQHRLGIPTVKLCAEQLNMSPGYFGEVVRRSLGQSPLQYIRGFVIDRAKSLLASGNNVTEVAYDLGFDYPQHFSRVFKNAVGMSPTEYLDGLAKSK